MRGALRRSPVCGDARAHPPTPPARSSRALSCCVLVIARWDKACLSAERSCHADGTGGPVRAHATVTLLIDLISSRVSSLSSLSAPQETMTRKVTELSFELGPCGTQDKVRRALSKEAAAARPVRPRMDVVASSSLRHSLTTSPARGQLDVLRLACSIAGISLGKGIKLPSNVADVAALWPLLCPQERIPQPKHLKAGKKRCAWPPVCSARRI